MSISTISWLATLAFVLVLLIGFFVGFWRGLRRSVLHFLTSIGGAVAAFFVTPIITNLVMGIQINSSGTKIPLNEFFVNLLKRNADIANLIENSPKLELFFERLPYAIGNAVLFILLTITIEMVLYVVYKILAAIFLKKKEGQKLGRSWGGLVNTASTFAIMVFVFMPFASLLGLATEVTSTDNTYFTETTAEENDNGLVGNMLPEIALNIVKGVDGSVLTKICGVFGMDNMLFDYYANVQMDNQTVYLREEVSNYYKVVDFAYQYKKQADVVYANINYDKLEKTIDGITDGGLFRAVISQTLADMVTNYDNYNLLRNNTLVTENADILAKISESLDGQSLENITKYFKDDVDNLFKAFKAVGKNGIVDEVLALEDRTASNVLKTVLSEDNIVNTKNALSKVVDTNMLRAALVPVANKGIEKLEFADIEQIGVNTATWTDITWDNFCDEVLKIAQLASDIINDVDLNVVDDFGQLFDSASEIDIEKVTTKIGQLVDQVRNMELLKTADNKSIIENLLVNRDLTLPTAPVHKVNETQVEIENYEQLMKFVAGGLVKAQQEGVYKALKDEETAKAKMLKLAQIVSKDGNEDLLKEILLPLYQVKFTKKLVFDDLLMTVTNELVDFTALTNYNEWKADLGYISDMLIATYKNKIGTKTYLEYALDGDVDNLVANMNDEKVDEVLKPILYAKSTAGIKVNLIATIKTVLDDVTSPAGNTIDITAVTLQEGNSEDQAQEICNVFKKFISIKNSYTTGTNVRDLDKDELGDLLNTMKLNAYRVDLASKTETGLFNGAFINLANTLRNSLTAEEREYLEATYSEDADVVNFLNGNYKAVNFVALMTRIDDAESHP